MDTGASGKQRNCTPCGVDLTTAACVAVAPAACVDALVSWSDSTFVRHAHISTEDKLVWMTGLQVDGI